jgi:hypothetical protein
MYPGVEVLLKKSLVASMGVVQGDVNPDQVSSVDTNMSLGRRSRDGREISAAYLSRKSWLSIPHTMVMLVLVLVLELVLDAEAPYFKESS